MATHDPAKPHAWLVCGKLTQPAHRRGKVGSVTIRTALPDRKDAERAFSKSDAKRFLRPTSYTLMEG